MGGSEMGLINEVVSDDGSTRSKGKKKDAPKIENAASVQETLSFAFNGPSNTNSLFVAGVISAIGNGMTYPIIAWIFAHAFTDIGSTIQNGLGPIKELAFWLMGLGVYALIFATIQTTCFEIIAYKASENLRLQWFHALLRQDLAFFDVYDVAGIAVSVSPAAVKYRRGIGRKLGEGIQFFTTGVGGVVYACWEEWRVALVVMAFCPFIAIFSIGVININKGKSSRSAAAYSKAGSVAYSTVSGIKTVLSLNAAPTMIQQYKEATLEAFNTAVRPLIRQGFVNGMMLGSFLCLYIVLTLYGTYNIYVDVRKTGCDPSGGLGTDSTPIEFFNETCTTSGPNVFGAMLGIAFAAQGISQVGTFLESFAASRVAAGQAITAINRKPGNPEEIIYHIEEGNDDADDNVSISSGSRHSSHMLESPEGRIKAILPAYEIVSMSTEGLKPENVKGRLTFDSVEFNYPTRPGQMVLNDLSIDIPEGTTIAFVGPSGGGKSTVVKMLERFYDPTAGSVKLDGIDIKDINVNYLRSMIGYVGQEPALFATTIRKNIAFGFPDCTQDDIEEAAKQANAHDFISQLPDGYDTDVGDKGSQLSGGQKQRIAIARVLIGDPKILLLDEATSALDSQSELVVQEALEKVISIKKRTTVIIAHRLSTIRNADTIAVVMGGTIVETGTHDVLMKSETYYKKLVNTQGVTAMKRKSSITQFNGQTESERGFGTIPEDFVDKDAAPLIVFRNVNFSYPTRPSKQILDRFKLKIFRGETIGLCGISGGGKSTVMGLIERFYDPGDGTVEFHGEDIKNLNVKWYRDQIGYVGQEPTLFDATIAENIAYGCPGATRDQIMEAAKQANAYAFIMKFPEDFDTPVSGGAGTQLSGGQKQRIAIARALVKKPEILLLDEATSALDNESERIVQEALNKLMEAKERTCIVIAHRLSTIRNASRIAFIGDGRVKEIGSHDELMEKSNGKYKRLVESQGRRATTFEHGLELPSKKKKKKGKNIEEENSEEQEDYEAIVEKEEGSAFSLARARTLASPDSLYLLIGSLGALMAGSIFPAWGLLFAETIELLFRPVTSCTAASLNVTGFATCEDEWNFHADEMKEQSFTLSVYWFVLTLICAFGNMILFWGFGNASERMSRRIRDSAFYALVRQEVAFFDKRSVGKITSELQEDATKVQIFTGDPIRKLLVAMSSLIIGLVLSFYYMWPFALLAVACVPFLGAATSIEMKQMMGEDEGNENGLADAAASSPGGIVVETLLNMGTVSALTMENERFKKFEEALNNSDENYVRDGLNQGVASGLSMFVQQWINALQFYFGGWILYKYPEQYDFNDFLISNFAVLFALFGLGTAFQDISDRKETEKSASRIFYLLDRKSEIDPLSKEGKTVDYSVPLPKRPKKKKSIKAEKKKKRASSLQNVKEENEDPGSTEVDKEDAKKSSSSLKKKKSKRSSKNASEENLDGTGKKPKSSKKKKSKKKAFAPDMFVPEEIVPDEEPFPEETVPEGSIEIEFSKDSEKKLSAPGEEIEIDFSPETGESPSDVAARIAALEEKSVLEEKSGH